MRLSVLLALFGLVAGGCARPDTPDTPETTDAGPEPAAAPQFDVTVAVPDGESASIGTYEAQFRYPDGRSFHVSGERNGTIAEHWFTDLGGNEKPELIIWMVNAGSGSYASVHIYWLTDEGPRFTDETDLPQAAQVAYQGHDSVFVADGKLRRCFPLIGPDDFDNRPTGHSRCVVYNAAMGWVIENA